MGFKSVLQKMDLLVLLSCFVLSQTSAQTFVESLWRPCLASRRRLPTHQMVEFDYGVPDAAPSRALRRYRHEMKIATRRARDTARDIYQHIRNERLPAILREDCRFGESLTGMPSVLGSSEPSSNPYSALPEDFDRLAVLTVFVHESSSNIRYHQSMESLKRRLLRLMCLVETTSLTMGQTIQNDVTLDVFPSQYRNLPDVAQRDRRNCLVVRDVYILLDSMATRYWPSA